jgi:hypothetical protein
MENKVYKIKSVLSLHALGLLRKIIKTKILIASVKTLTNSETCTLSRIKILPRLTISVIGQFFPRDHLLLDRGKVGLNMYTCHGRFTEQFLESGASFTLTIVGGFLNAAASSLKRVTGRIFKISKCFQRSNYRKNLAFDFLSNKDHKTTSAYTESTDSTL